LLLRAVTGTSFFTIVGTLDGAVLCRMFNRAIRGQRWMPNYLSSDKDPLFRFHQWQANLRVLKVTQIKLSMANCYFTNVHRQNSERFQNE
jgi:hypothetical protein